MQVSEARREPRGVQVVSVFAFDCQSAPRPSTTGVWCPGKSSVRSGDELADATGGLDALLGDLGELLGADDAGSVGELALAQNLEVALMCANRQTRSASESRLLFNKKQTYSLGNIDHSRLLLGGSFACLLGHESPQLVKVHRRAVVLVSLIVEMSLSLLSVVVGVTVQAQRVALSII